MKQTQEFHRLARALEDIGLNIKIIEPQFLQGLIFNSRRRYNRYDMYEAGDTFDRRLIRWLMNFNAEERNLALNLINNIIYISKNELRTLAEYVLDLAATITWNEIFNHVDDSEQKEPILELFHKEIKKNIFVALSDDIGLDYFRRLGRRRFPQLEKENFVEYYKVHEEDLDDINNKIRNPRSFILIDQICASGTTALRLKSIGRKNEYKGKLRTFFNRWRELIAGKNVYYVPLIASSFVESLLIERLEQLKGDVTGISDLKILPILIVEPSKWLISKHSGTPMIDNDSLSLLQKYYFKFREDEHTSEGLGTLFGVGCGGLSLIIGTNCPNNAMYIIWHQFSNWYPLFPRIAHHKSSTTPINYDTVEEQIERLTNNIRRPISSSALQLKSIVELENNNLKYKIAASLPHDSNEYISIVLNNKNKFTFMEQTKYNIDINKMISMLKDNLHSDCIELWFNPKIKGTDEPIITNKQYEKCKLHIPFLSTIASTFTPPPKSFINDIITIPAVMIPLSGTARIDAILSAHAEYIDLCKVRTEKFLYLPIESPAISFRRTCTILEGYHKHMNINYEEMCLTPGSDSTSMLISIALGSLLNIHVNQPRFSLINIDLVERNLVLMTDLPKNCT